MTFQQHIDALHSALAQTRIDSGGPATCSVIAEDLRVALHLIGQAALVPSAASAEPVSQYFHRVAGCPTHRASDAECICWHDKGTGPYPDARVGDIYNGVTLTWRTKPATPVAASAEPVADERAVWEKVLLFATQICRKLDSSEVSQSSASGIGHDACERAIWIQDIARAAQPVAYLHTSNRTLTWPGKLTEVQLNSGVWRPLYEHPAAPQASTVAGEAVAWQYFSTVDQAWCDCDAERVEVLRNAGLKVRPLYAAPASAETDWHAVAIEAQAERDAAREERDAALRANQQPADDLVASLRSMASVAPAAECEILLAAANALSATQAEKGERDA